MSSRALFLASSRFQPLSRRFFFYVRPRRSASRSSWLGRERSWTFLLSALHRNKNASQNVSERLRKCSQYLPLTAPKIAKTKKTYGRTGSLGEPPERSFGACALRFRSLASFSHHFRSFCALFAPFCALSLSAIVKGATHISKIDPSDNSISFLTDSKFAAFFKRSIALNDAREDLGLVVITKIDTILF